MKTTAIIPAYNAAAYITEALGSIFRQSRPADEVIVVDDCSTDETRDLVTRFPVKLFSTSVNSGHAAARNIGVAAATGELIAWLDADDYWDPCHLETVVAMLEHHPNAAVAFSGVRFVGDRVGVWNTFPCNGSPRNVFESAIAETIVPAMSAVTRRDALQSVGGFNEGIRVAPDFDLWLRLSVNNLFLSTSAVTSNYRWHGRQISSTKGNEQLRSMFKARNDIVQAIRECGDNGKADLAERETVRAYNRHLWRAWDAADSQMVEFLIRLSDSFSLLRPAARSFKRIALLPRPLVRFLRNAERVGLRARTMCRRLRRSCA